MKLTYSILFAVLLSGCRSAAPSGPTTQPQAPAATLICASGQSNMGEPPSSRGLLPALQALTAAQGWSEGAQPIRFWDADQRGWRSTVPFLTPACTSFIWFQGETDDVGGESPDFGQFGPTPVGVYRVKATDLFARVRARTSADLPIYVIQIAPRFVVTRAEQAAACYADTHCTYVPTNDLSFPDGTHLDAAGYRTLAQLLVTLTRTR